MNIDEVYIEKQTHILVIIIMSVYLFLFLAKTDINSSFLKQK